MIYKGTSVREWDLNNSTISSQTTNMDIKFDESLVVARYNEDFTMTIGLVVNTKTLLKPDELLIKGLNITSYLIVKEEDILSEKPKKKQKEKKEESMIVFREM